MAWYQTIFVCHEQIVADRATHDALVGCQLHRIVVEIVVAHLLALAANRFAATLLSMGRDNAVMT